KQRGSRKTTWISDTTRRLDCFAICLRKPISELGLSLDRAMFASVMLRKNVCIAQAEISRKIDHLHLRRQPRCNLHSLTMRQCKKCEIQIIKPAEFFSHFDKF